MVGAGSSAAGIITAVASVLTALGLLVTALTLFLPILRRTRAVEQSVTEVHTIVNQQRTDSKNYQAALVAALTKAGIDVPADQSLPRPDAESERPPTRGIGS